MCDKGVFVSSGGRRWGCGDPKVLSPYLDLSQGGSLGCQGMLTNAGKKTLAAPAGEQCTWWPSGAVEAKPTCGFILRN